MNNKVEGLNGCFKEVPEAESALRWAGFCKTVGWIIFVLGIIISLFWKTFFIFLITITIGFVFAATFWILGAVLNAMGSTAQSSAEMTRLTYLYVKTSLEEYSANKTQNKEPEWHTYLPDTRWICPNCGADNDPFCNICNKCGDLLKKVDN